MPLGEPDPAFRLPAPEMTSPAAGFEPSRAEPSRAEERNRGRTGGEERVGGQLISAGWR